MRVSLQLVILKYFDLGVGLSFDLEILSLIGSVDLQILSFYLEMTENGY